MKKYRKPKKKQHKFQKNQMKRLSGEGNSISLGGEQLMASMGADRIEATEPALPLDMVFLEMEVERHLGLCP